MIALPWLVEDDPFIRGTLGRILGRFGFSDVRDASDGTGAMALLGAGHRPGPVLCDVRMAPMDGLTFLRRLRADPDRALAKAHVVMLTGATDDEALRTARGLGIGGYLVKPVWPSALAERLAIVLGGRSGPGNQPA